MAHPRPARRCALAAALGAVAVVTVVGASPALAGGSWLEPVRDRYEPGDVATLVGYVGRGQLGWVEDGPFLAYLRAGDLTPDANPGFTDQGVPVGALEVEPVDGPDPVRLRVSLTFRLPDALPPGIYGIVYCNEPCTNGLGDLIGGHVYVGTDPPAPIRREWPPDEPEIQNLAPEAIVTFPGQEAAAAAPAAPRPRIAPPVTTVPALAPVARPPAPAPVAAPIRPAGNEDRWPVVLGSALAAVCTLSVLAALRRGRIAPEPRTAEARELEPLAR